MCEKTINFILLKLRPFCDPEAVPSHSWELSQDICLSLSLASPFFFPPSFTKVSRLPPWGHPRAGCYWCPERP